MRNLNPKHKTDEEIINEILNGNISLFEILFKKYHARVLDKCFSLLRDNQLAQEFAQDIFSKVYEKLNGFKGKSSFSSWLYAITYNHCIEYLRHKKRLHYPEWNRNQELPDLADEVSESVIQEIRYERLMKIFEKIHPEEKVLLMMKYQDDIPVKLIMTTFRISESAAKMRIKRAKARVLYLYRSMYPDPEI